MQYQLDKKIKVFLAVHDAKIYEQCYRCLKQSREILLIGSSRNGEDAFQKIRKEKPDLVIAEVLMPGMDGYTLIELLEETITFQLPDFVLCYTIMPGVLWERDKSGAVIHYLPFPMKDRILERQMRASIEFHIKKKWNAQSKNCFEKGNVVAESCHYDPGDSVKIDCKEIIGYELERLGASSHQKGYYYLVSAIFFVVESEWNTPMRMMELYDKVAQTHDGNAQSVERSIRTTVRYIWQRGNRDHLKECWGFYHINEYNRPSNSRFIHHIANRIRREYLL